MTLLWWTAMHWGPGSDSASAYMEWLGEDATAGGSPIRLGADYFQAWDASSALNQGQRDELDESNRSQLDQYAAQAMAVLGPQLGTTSANFPKLLDERCLPTLSPLTFRDRVEAGPWLGPSPLLQPPVEARAWARHAAELDGPVAILVMDNSWGDSFLGPLEVAVARLGQRDQWIAERHDPAATELGSHITALLAHDPVAVYLATAGNPCLVATRDLRNAGFEGLIVVPSVCTDRPAYLDPLQRQADGLLAVFAAATAHAGPFGASPLADDARNLTPTGDLQYGTIDQFWLATWHAVEVIKIAAELEGGLTRANVLLAMWSFEGRHPFAAGSISTRWPDDTDLVDATTFLTYDLEQQRWADPTAVQSPVDEG